MGLASLTEQSTLGQVCWRRHVVQYCYQLFALELIVRLFHQALG